MIRRLSGCPAPRRSWSDRRKTQDQNHRLIHRSREVFWYGRRVGDLLGYARVSTVDQRLDLQLDALKTAGCKRVWSDTASGSLTERPELSQVFDHLRWGDTLVVWRLDRLGRSVRHLVDVVAELGERGIGLRSLQEGIDTTTPGGRLVFHVFSALAQFEREVVIERSRAGVAAARARGRVGGRPALMTPAKLATARRLREGRDHTLEEIADVIGVSRSTLVRHLAACGTSKEIGLA
jgi:DNA invertase Pin-like site-specific DNA recombinase